MGQPGEPARPSDALSARTVETLVPRPSAWYTVAGLALVAGAVALLEWNYRGAPMPPGFDTAHWLWTSYAYYHLPYPPASAVGSPYSVPPLPFLFLGALVRLFGSPFTAAFVFLGLMLAAYGLTVVHLARVYVLTGPFQVLLVGLAVFNGTTLSVLFWGGIPNFMGFIFLNESMALLLLFVRTGRLLHGLFLYGALALDFMTHDLSFVIALASVAMAALFLIVFRRLKVGFLLRRANLLGAGLLAGVVALYFGATRLLAVSHPGLLFSNPATYVIANIGQVFNPLTTSGCLCPSYEIPVAVSVGLLFGIPLALGALFFRFRKIRALAPISVPPELSGSARAVMVRPYLVDRALIVALGWVAGSLIVPAVGYLAHVDTDYLRFGYYLPLPLTFLGVLLLERFSLPWVLRKPLTAPLTRSSPAPAPGARATIGERAAVGRRARRRVSPNFGPALAVHAAVAAVVLLFIAGYAAPLAARSETLFTGPTHDANFLNAMAWLKQTPQPGGVLTEDGALRWIQALTARASFNYAPTWVLFYPWQIANAQESYLALNSHLSVTNNNVSWGYSGNSSTPLGAVPLYVALVEGVVFPVFRVAQGSSDVNVTLNGLARHTTPAAWGPPTVTLTPGAQPSIFLSYSGPLYNFTELDQVGIGGSAWLNVSIQAQPTVALNGYSFSFTPPPQVDPAAHFGKVAAVSFTRSSFAWTVGASLGQIPGTYLLKTTGDFSRAPSFLSLSPTNGPSALTVGFSPAAGRSSLSFSLHLTTPGTGNPAVSLPSVLDTVAFLQAHQIHFVVLPNSGASLPTTRYYQNEFNFQLVYSNPEWVILEG